MEVSRAVASLDSSRWRVLAWIAGVTPWLLTTALGAQTVPEDYPSQVIALADWGMSDASEIGYLHVGVLHEPQGDRLAVYDLRLNSLIFRRTPTKKANRQILVNADATLAPVDRFGIDASCQGIG